MGSICHTIRRFGNLNGSGTFPDIDLDRAPRHVEAFVRSRSPGHVFALSSKARLTRSSSPPLLVIVRSAGERTRDVALHLIKAQLPTDAVAMIVEGRPFEATLRQSMSEGVRLGAEWTVMIDADVLLMPGAIEALRRRAAVAPARVCMLQGRVFDMITANYRIAGNRVYRTSRLPILMSLIPPAGSAIRPESAMLAAAAARGLASRFVPDIVGLHDFEQFYVDLYRKAFVHARKHRDWLPELMIRFRRASASSPEAAVMLRAIEDSVGWAGAVSIDAGMYEQLSASALKDLGIEERSSAPESFSSSVLAPGWMGQMLPLTPPRDAAVFDASPADRRADLLRSMGWPRYVMYLFGAALSFLGARLKSASGEAHVVHRGFGYGYDQPS